jgi:hypothetical protein
MAEKLTINHMSVEMDVLWGRLKELELSLSKKLDFTVKNTTSKLKQHFTAVSSRRLGDLVISNDLRNELIQLAAYYKAERNGFAEGGDEQNWLEAEQEVDIFLLGGDVTADSPEVFTGRAGPDKIAEARKAVSQPEQLPK